jgi:hypothetical protein
MNATLLREQEKDIEIERLKTTCKTLNAKCQINDDLHEEIDIMRRRLSESERLLKICRDENSVLREQNEVMKIDLNSALMSKFEMQGKLEDMTEYVL